MSRFPTFINGTYVSQSPISDQEELINWYVETMESQGATSKASLYPTPGVEAFTEVAAVGGRAMITITDGGVERCFGVVQGTLYEFLSGGTSTSRGTVAVDANPATICTNGDGGGQLFITSGGNGYNYDLASNVLTQVLTGDATMGGMLYGYFLAFDKTTGRVRLSDLFDGTVWDPTQYFERTIGADAWQAMLVTPYGYICLPGTQTGEFWYNAGSFPIPFAPDPSGLFSEGVAATFSITQVGSAVTWLSTNSQGDYQVKAATGFTPQRISDHSIEYLISSFSRIDDAIGQTYGEHGHAFYLLTFPSARITLVYDFTEQKWHKRGTWIREQSQYQYWRPVFHCFAFGRQLMADRETGVIYRMGHDLPLDVDGREIRRVRRAPSVVDENKRVFHDWFELLLETGLGNDSSSGASPTVMLRYSDDGGQTWGNQLQAGAGAIGAFNTRVYWTRLGMARQRVYEVTVTDPVIGWRITDAFLRVRRSTEGRAA